MILHPSHSQSQHLQEVITSWIWFWPIMKSWLKMFHNLPGCDHHRVEFTISSKTLLSLQTKHNFCKANLITTIHYYTTSRGTAVSWRMTLKIFSSSSLTNLWHTVQRRCFLPRCSTGKDFNLSLQQRSLGLEECQHRSSRKGANTNHLTIDRLA